MHHSGAAARFDFLQQEHGCDTEQAHYSEQSEVIYERSERCLLDDSSIDNARSFFSRRHRSELRRKFICQDMKLLLKL